MSEYLKSHINGLQDSKQAPFNITFYNKLEYKEGIQRLVQEVMDERGILMPGTNKVVNVKELAKQVTNMNTFKVVWVALDGEQVIGTAALIELENGDFILGRLHVKDGYRRLGIATRLMTNVFRYVNGRVFNSERCIWITTMPEKFPEAISLYLKLGFEFVNESDLPKCYPKNLLNEVFMKQKIKNIKLEHIYC